jgi:CBS domain-containing protein
MTLGAAGRRIYRRRQSPEQSRYRPVEAVVQVRDVMTREVVSVGPDTSARLAAKIMAERGFAAVPVVDDANRVIGIVAEADVLRDRMPQDPRLHLRREPGGAAPPPMLVRGVMTAPVRTVLVTADVADVARIFLDERLRSVPVVDGERLAGIVSRRDLLRTLIRSDDEVRHDVRRLVESYTGRFDSWQVEVAEGVVALSPVPAARPAGDATGDATVAGIADEIADEDEAVESRAVVTLARTVPGVVAVRLQSSAPGTARGAPPAAQPAGATS